MPNNKDDINKIISLFDQFNIKKANESIKLNEDIPKNAIGRGQNATCYLLKNNNKQILSKEQKIYYDTHLIKINNNFALVTQTAINETIISNLISKLKNKYPNIQKMYGYSILESSKDTKLTIYKEYIPYEFKKIIPEMHNYSQISLLLLHLLLHVYSLFQSGELDKGFIGYHGDLKVKNIMIKDSTLEKIEYIINGEKIVLPVWGQLPVLIDFGNTVILKSKELNNKHIYAHCDWKSQKEIEFMRNLIGDFDDTFDVFGFFRSFLRFHNDNIIVSKVYYNLLEKEKLNVKDNVKHIKNGVNIQKIINDKRIQQFIKSISP